MTSHRMVLKKMLQQDRWQVMSLFALLIKPKPKYIFCSRVKLLCSFKTTVFFLKLSTVVSYRPVQCAAPVLWNSLPLTKRTRRSLAINFLKSILKHFFLGKLIIYQNDSKVQCFKHFNFNFVQNFRLCRFSHSMEFFCYCCCYYQLFRNFFNCNLMLSSFEYFIVLSLYKFFIVIIIIISYKTGVK